MTTPAVSTRAQLRQKQGRIAATLIRRTRKGVRPILPTS
jgi:hypothetical protein